MNKTKTERDIDYAMQICNKEVKIAGHLLRIARLDADKYQFISEPDRIIDGLRKSRERIDLFSFMQSLADTKPKYYYPMEWDNLAVLPITTFENWWNQQIGFKARNKAKQAGKKDVRLREVPFDEGLVRGIWSIYNESPVRQGRLFTHYGKDLDTVRREEATYLGSSTFIGAFYGEELIGFVKLVADESGVQVGLMNIISKIGHRDKAPTNALIAEAVRFCGARRIPNLVYSNFAYGRKERSSVSDFKERSGFQRIDVPRYYVPLTAFGSAAFRMGFHHRWVDRVPEPVAEKLRQLRTSWYNRKFQSVSENS